MSSAQSSNQDSSLPPLPASVCPVCGAGQTDEWGNPRIVVQGAAPLQQPAHAASIIIVIPSDTLLSALTQSRSVSRARCGCASQGMHGVYDHGSGNPVVTVEGTSSCYPIAMSPGVAQITPYAVQHRALMRKRRRFPQFFDWMLWLVVLVVWGMVIWRFFIEGTEITVWTPFRSGLEGHDRSVSERSLVREHPFAIYAPPSITADQYVAFWRHIDHPLAGSAYEVYNILVEAGIDPAIHAAVAQQEAHEAGDSAFPPPRGQFNLHGLTQAGCRACPDHMLSFDAYPAAVHAWIRVIRTSMPPSITAPPTLDALVALRCPAPQCNTEMAQQVLRQTVLHIRQSRP